MSVPSKPISDQIREILARNKALRKQDPNFGKPATREELRAATKLAMRTIDEALKGNASLSTLAAIELALEEKLDRSGYTQKDVAPFHMGSYARATVEGYEGCYVIFHPTFSNDEQIYAYTIDMKWSDEFGALHFQETNKNQYCNAGYVHIPVDALYINLLSIYNGLVRNIAVSKPKNGIGNSEKTYMHGLMSTMRIAHANSLVPMTTPIVMYKTNSDNDELYEYIVENGNIMNKTDNSFEYCISLLKKCFTDGYVSNSYITKQTALKD